MPIPALAAQPRSVASVDSLDSEHSAKLALTELTVADGASADIGELISSVHTRLLLLGPSGRALARISSAIEGCHPDVLHIVAHGRVGAISLGGEWISTRDLAAASGMLSKWRVGTIALWSCHGGADQAFGQVLAALTGARVLVSPGPLGMVDGQPRWDLFDTSDTAIPAHLGAPFDPAVMQAWPHQLAKLSFVNAYAVNTATTPAAKEANAVDFIPTALNVARIDDRSGGVNFSGNDVVVEALIDGVTYYGWVSRPIKSGGVVRGYYFWSDPQFSTLSAATTDGNADGDSNALDNRGFVLVVDQAWFDAQPLLAGGLKNVGTSSDRVDAGLNGLLAVNSAPLPTNDAATVLEDGGPQSGTLLPNDSDANLDALVVTGFAVGGSAGTLGVAKAIAGVGSLTVLASGGWTFTPSAGYAGPVPLVTYTVSDGRGGAAAASLSLTVARVNDAPSGADKTISAPENTAYSFSAADFGFSDGADAPANSLAGVVITTLPAHGVLSLNGVAVSAGMEIAAADLTKLKFTPAANASGTGYASFTFQVRDNGGTASGGIDLDASPNTITFNVQNINNAPQAQADSGASGNLLANDSDLDAGDTLSVSAAAGKGNAVAVGSGTVVTGSYGSLTVSSDGSYSYAADGSNATVKALNAGASLTDSFTYTMRDAAGLTSSASLSVTVNGANDAVIAVNDFDYAVASSVPAAQRNPSGNVLTNDRDPDSGDSFSVTRASAGSTLGGTIVTLGAGGQSASGDESRVYTGILTQGAGNIQNNAAVSGAGIPPGTTVASVANNSGTRTVTFTNAQGGKVALDGVASITIGSNTYTVDGKVGQVSNMVGLTNVSGAVTQGMQAGGTGIQAGTTVTAVTTAGSVTFVTLSQAVSGTLGTDLTFGSTSTSIAGQYGLLALQEDGSYTYTYTHASLTGVDTFTYEVRDSHGATSTARLTIDVIASSVTPPTAGLDSASATEDGAAASGNVLANDVQNTGVKAVSHAWTPSASSMTAVSGGGVQLTGSYGTLTIASDGSYTYAADNANASVNALAAGETLSERFSYRIGSSSDGYASATLTITINGANDAPVAAFDTAAARESGAAAGVNAAGNLLANDSDPDHGALLGVTHIGTSSATETVGAGRTVTGSYGALTVSANGTYQYVADNANSAVNAMNAGASLQDSFTYAVSDGTVTRTETLTVTIHGANDAPVLSTGAGPTIMEGVSGQVTGIAVADADDAQLAVSLAVANGLLTIGTLGAASISAGSSGSAALTLSGSAADINAALATLSYQGAPDYAGIDNLRVSALDAGGLVAVANVDVTVSPDNRALTVLGATVNEASSYAIFSVGGAAGQKVTLALAPTGSGSGHAQAGADYVDSLEYYDGAAWHSYTGVAVAIPAGGALLVRSALLNDLQAEGAETFRLSAANRAGVAASADAIIVDDGSGLTYDGNVSAGTPDSAGVNLDDDRALTVSKSTVNEKSPYALFTLGGASGQQVALSLANGNASDLDHGTAIEYWDGAAWQAYSAPLTLGPSGSLSLRVAIVDDGVYEGPEIFGLVAVNGSGRAFVGTATIVDDGTGLRYPGTLNASVATGLDNDLAVSVQAHGPVNEASNYAMFTVSATAGEVLDLALSASGLTPAGAHNFTLEYSLNGSSWTAYDSSTQPLVPGNGTLYVRAGIASEQDAIIEGAETFTLTASTGSGAGASGSAVSTIVDDGSGSRYPGTLTGGVPDALTTSLDLDVLADTVAPTIAIASDKAALALGQSATITFTLSEASTSFTAADVQVSGGTLSHFTAHNATSYSATFTPTANSTANGVLHVAGATFADNAGNLNADGSDPDNTVTMQVNTVPPVVVTPPAPPAPVQPAPLAAPSVTIVEDQDNNGILSRTELQGQVDVSIGLPAGAKEGDVLVVSDGVSTQHIGLGAAILAQGSVGASFAAPAPNSAIEVTARVGNGASGSDSAVRGSGVALAVTAISPDTGVEGDFITSAKNLVFSGTAESGTLVTVKLNGTVLGNVLAVNDRWSYDNSAVALTRVDNELTLINGNDPRDTATVMIRSFSAELNPDADDGASNTDRQTSVTNPDFILKAQNIMAAGDTARLLAPDGHVAGSLAIDAASAAAGTLNVPTEQLDDGTYTFMAQILDANGNVKAEQPVSVTIVTDRDGVMPSVELAAHGGDFNRDGILDWKQNNVAQLPLQSVDAFAAGKHAPQASFGAIMAGGVGTAAGAVQLDPNAQLMDVGVSTAPAALPANTVGASPMLAFTVTGANGAQLADLDPGRAGLQTRVVIDLGDGVNANSFLKFDRASGQWYNFVDDGRLDTLDDGATLLDTDGDGRTDRLVITLTDGARGDEDGVANGTIVDPGMLAMTSSPVYSVRLANGDRYYTVDARDAARAAAGTGNLFEGARFDSLAPDAGGRQMHAKWQPFTGDWYFGASGQADPYLCYELVPSGAGFMAAAASSKVGQRFHLYQNDAGQTQLVTQAEAAALGLAGHGFVDRGAQFSTTTNSAFSFDAEAYLIANKDSAATRAFVQALSAEFKHSGDAGFIEAVEQHYLSQVGLVGVAHGGTANVAELNAVFGTQFL